MTPLSNNRHIPLEGSLNFRDFGDYPTLEGRQIMAGYFFRSDKLSHLSNQDHAILNQLNIRSIYDLRRPDETAHAPTKWGDPSVEIHTCSILHPSQKHSRYAKSVDALRETDDPGGALMENLYQEIGRGEQSFQHFKKIFEHILYRPDDMLLVHCSGGKDRTGVTCALIQWVLGCDMSLIMHDYMLSQPLYCDKVDPLKMYMQIAQIDPANDLQAEWLTPIMQVRPEYLNAMFSVLLERYPTPQEFLHEGLQLPFDSLEKIRQQYTQC